VSEEPPPWLDDEVPDETDSPRSAEAIELPEDLATELAAPSPANPPTTPAPTPMKLVTTALGDRWAELLRPVLASGSVVALVRELALQAELIAVEQRDGFTFWRLRVERESLRTNALRDKLQAALQAATDPMLKLELEAGVPVDSMAKRDSAEREAAQREAEQLIQGDPAVRALMAQFRTARIVPGSIKPIAEPRNPTP
jgi:DNA polymerase-3 subunit gamma/tau